MYVRLPAVLTACGGIIVAVVSESWVAVVTYLLLLALACVVDALLAPSPVQIHIERHAPASVRLGKCAQVTYTVTSRTPIVGEFRDAWVPSAGLSPTRHSFDTRIPAQAQAVMCPTRRGTLSSSAITIRTRGPLHLAGRQSTRPTAWTLLVLPAFTSARVLGASLKQLRQLDGHSLFLHRGEGTEFDSLRDYVAGDDVRAIDWRSTARLGRTLVRTWLPERDRKIMVVLDSGRGLSLRSDDSPRFDAAIETALLMSALASKAGDALTVVALDHMIRAHVSPQRSHNPVADVGAALANVEASAAATDLRLLMPLVYQQRPSLIIVITDPTTVNLDHLVALRATCRIIVASVTIDSLEASPDAVWNAYLRAADAREYLDSLGYQVELTRQAVRVVNAPAGQLPARIADEYLMLKAAGAL
ncbi:DUF58 domain-containing protein [Arcanobacterium canis]